MNYEIPIKLESLANKKAVNFFADAARRKKLRESAWFMTKSAMHKNKYYPGANQDLAITLTRIAPRRLDDDNLRTAFKSVRDGIVEALDRKNDNEHFVWCYRQVTTSEYRQLKNADQNVEYTCWITIEEI